MEEMKIIQNFFSGGREPEERPAGRGIAPSVFSNGGYFSRPVLLKQRRSDDCSELGVLRNIKTNMEAIRHVLKHPPYGGDGG